MEAEFQMKFVRPADGNLTPALEEAAKMLVEHGLTPDWMDQDQCLNADSAQKNCVYVVDPFEGAAFEHVKQLGCRVFGPQCILASLNMKVELPQKKRPIYSVAMKGVTVSCTSLDRQTRDNVHHLVELMAGEASKNLTADVTHLVAGEVGSQKYTVSASRGTPIMSVEWVTDLWQMAQSRYVHAMDPQVVQKYRCPIFKGLVVTVSGLSAEERKQVKRFVESEGGTYTGEMKMNECTHLIVKEPKGQKYDYASKWKIHIVTMQWVIDSLEKNYCQAETNYPVTGSAGATGVKTSTPEKSRLSAINPNIQDISAISATHIDETAFLRTRTNDMTMEHFDTLDLTHNAAENYLDSCRIYLSDGVRGPLLEKCRKIINAAGATRLNEICDKLTHVVMEDKVDREITAVSSMSMRPHVVSPVWLAECFRQSCHVDEQSYRSPHLPTPEAPPEVQLPTLPAPKRTANKNKAPKAEVPSSSTAVVEKKDDGDEEGDMEQLLSQYMEDGASDKETTLQGMDEVDGNTSVSRQGAGGHSSKEEDADATQDPEHEETVTGDGVFRGKTFIFLGFSEEDVGVLTEFVAQAGGVCLKGRRKVADYGVVPILGFPVEQTVGEVVTNAWLQMCLESEERLATDSNPIFRPIDVDDSAKPLEGCVLSVSGYSGVERDCLAHIADVLGAVCQEFFVRVANKSLKASTHLIVKEASGSKYTAAKKWNIPAVTKDWLFACATSGERKDEKVFSIDNASKKNTASASSLAPTAQSSEKPGSDQGVRPSTADKAPSPVPKSVESCPGLGQQGVEAEAADLCAKPSDNDNSPMVDLPRKHQNRHLSEHAPPSSSGESMKSTSADNAERVPTSSASDREQVDARSCHMNNPMSSAKAAMQQSQELRQSQKENRKEGLCGEGGQTATPRAVKKAIAGEEQRHQSLLSPGLDSPSVFLKPGYRPKFNLEGVYEYLKSPEEKRKSLTIQEVFEYHLSEAVKKISSSNQQRVTSFPESSQSSQSEDQGPLEGVVIAVSKKLSVNQMEYNTMVVELGGDYSWHYSSTCTHFIFQGRANDLNKEFRNVRSQGKFIVSPYWLYACKEQRCRVDEAMYPHNYNPNLNLGGVVQTETPGRELRRATRSTPRPAPNTSNSRTPVRPSTSTSSSSSSSSSSSNTTTSTNITTTTATISKSLGKSAASVWQESMDEMKKWQEGQSTNTNTYSRGSRGSAKKRMGSVVEVSAAVSPPPAAEREGSVVPDRAQASSSSPAVEKALTSPSSPSAGKVQALSSSPSPWPADVSDDKESRQIETPQGGASLEIREALSKTLETFKASSSRLKKSSRKQSKRSDGNSSGGQINTSGNLSGTSAAPYGGPWQTGHKGLDPGPVTESMGAEASQSVDVTWDDPTGRREKEILAHKLEMVCGSSQNTQNTEDFMANMDMPELEDPSPSVAKKSTSSRQPRNRVRSPTPEPPPLAFPPAKCVSKVSSPQPIELLSDESSDSHGEHAVKPIILTSGMEPQERIEFAEVIERLGGTLLEKQQFDQSCTHVVVIKPSRNEKFLAAVATGRWVLHKSYLIACRQEGRFVREEDHEWGNPAMTHLMQSLDSQTYSLVQSAHRWRQKVHSMRKTDRNCPGAFQGWRVILLTEPKRESNFRRLLTAGGATVLNVRPPMTEVEATHAFVDLHKVKLAESDLEALVRGANHVLKPDFIAAHLTSDPPPDPHSFTPPEVDKLRTRPQMNQSRKRRASQRDSINPVKASRR